jgi:hypothetical protein
MAARAKNKATKSKAKKNGFDDMIDQPNTALAETEEDTSLGTRKYTTTPDFDKDDLLIPRLRIAQGLTMEVQDGVAKPGDLVLVGHEPCDEAHLVPLLVSKTREMRDPDSREVLCSADDAITGVGDPGGDCGTCIMAKWADGNDGRRIPPSCSVIYAYICWSDSHQSHVLLEFSRTALATARQLNTVIRARGLKKFAFKLASAQQKGARGVWHTPVVSLLTDSSISEGAPDVGQHA